MAKTYNTISTFTSGQILTATQMNQIGTNSNNYRVPPACRVQRTGQALANGAAFAFTSTAVFDTESPSDPMHSTSVQNTRITIRTAGIYVMQGEVVLGTSATGTLRGARIVRNGTSDISSNHVPSNNSYNLSACVSVIFSMSVGDYVELVVSQDTGGNLTCDGKLAVAWVGQAS